MSSTVNLSTRTPPLLAGIPTISKADIALLRSAASEATMNAEVASYLHNITIFMRLSRYIAGGVSALATKHLRIIVGALAPLHNLNYCTPSLVALAARKIYPHRIVLANSKTERSLQWGSDPRVVDEILQGLTADDAIEATLSAVEAPL